MITETEANKIFQELMSDYASQIGFEYHKNDGNKYSPPNLFRKTTFGFEKIGDLFLEVYNGKLIMSCAFSKRIDKIESIWSKFYTQLNTVAREFEPETLCQLATNPKRISDYVYDSNNILKWIRTKDRYEVPATHADIKDLTRMLEDNLTKYALPVFKQYDTVEAIDREMNATPDRYFECIHLFTGDGLMFKKMITAKLSGNDNYNIICERVKEYIETTFDSVSVPSLEKYLQIWKELKLELDGI